MRVLLNTHAFLWLATDDKKAGSKWKSIVEDVTNDILLSTASPWEIAIKTSIQKLSLPVPFEGLIEKNVNDRGIQTLSILPSHLSEIIRLRSIVTIRSIALLLLKALWKIFPSLPTIRNSGNIRLT